MNKVIIDQIEFEIVAKIADGGMGSVYKAQQKGIHGFSKTVAIKAILEDYSTDEQFIRDFIDEAILVANLIHENIVQIYQLGKFRREYYFVLEYVDGISLFDFIDLHQKLKQRLPVPLAVFIASRVARGLAYAHARTDADGNPMNIVHCDVCPHNVLLNTEGVPKLTDFGIARATSRKNERYGMSGKLPFISPEQAEMNSRVDFHSDIYSLGVILFYLLTQGFPRNLNLTVKEMVAEIRGNYINWELLPPDIDDELREIMRRMLNTAPGERFATTADLARTLEYYIYKDGYGPTIVTLSNYMKTMLPGVFTPSGGGDRAVTGIGIDVTTRMPLPGQWEKTMKMPTGE